VKKLFSITLLLCFIMPLCILCSCGSEKGAEGLEYYPISDTECAVSVGKAQMMKEIVIPSKYKQYTVTIINGSSVVGGFANCAYLEKITIPDSVTQIGDGAFSGCSSLTSVTIPDSVTSIGNSAFYGCGSLTSITIPFVGAKKDGTENTHFGYIFGASSYSDNKDDVPSSLKTVVITGGSSIGEDAFAYCSRLTSIAIPNSVTSIGEYAFRGCSSLTSVTIPNNVTSIERYAFSGCSSLTSVTIPNSVTSIGEDAFFGCSSLTSITVPNSVTSIERYAFSGCSSLTSITIGNSVTSIGGSAFRGCSSLTSITIPNSVTSIGFSAFSGCSSLESITIPSSVKYIDDLAFYECDNLTIYCRASSKPSGWSGWWNDGNCPVYWYSETQPTTAGKYWHYVDGVPTAWKELQ